MNKDQVREIVQLILAAKQFINLSKRRLAKLSQDSKQTKIKDLAKKFESLGWSKSDNDLLILTSYLSSCGIRISTIYEIINVKPNFNELYSGRLDPKHTCHFLRDNVCHREPTDRDKEECKKRQAFLDELTVQQLYEYVSKALTECKDKIVEVSGNHGLLESFIKKKFKNI